MVANYSQSLICLPIDSEIPRILGALERSPSLVLQAAPGAGKTTRVPPAILSAQFVGKSEILVLEPRRLAAKMAARRVAEERGENIGETVGYQFRFENISGPKTRLRFLTEGMLMRRLLGDPKLKGVGAVILDEFHERHLHGDVALAFLRRLQQSERPDLRLLVMSATLDTEAVSAYLGNCPSIRVEGRQFPVEIEYLPPVVKASERPLEFLVRDAVKEALATQPGDLLVFLPGMADIRRSAQALESLAMERNFTVLPLHGELSREEQDRAIRRLDRTKVILSTNVAETSLTIDGVTTVIDGGLARVASYSWWSGLPALRTRPISRASATQRAGRAGRTAPGRCFRLYSKHDFEHRPSFDTPEIARADLSQTVLELKSLGVEKLEEFSWFETPPVASLEGAVTLLKRLGALDKGARITPLGREMVEMPAHPRLARLVSEAAKRGVGEEGAFLAALFSEGRFENPLFFFDLEEELVKARRYNYDDSVRKMHQRLTGVTGRGRARTEVKPCARDEAIRFSLLAAFPDRVARLVARKDGVEFVFSGGGSATLDDEGFKAASKNWGEFYVVTDVEEQKGARAASSRIRARSACPIEPEWLFDLEFSEVEEKDELFWDEARGRIQARSQLRYGQLVLSESQGAPGGARDLKAAATFLAEMIFKAGLEKICDREALELLRARVAFLSSHRPDLGLPVLDEAEQKNALTELCAGKISIAEVRDADFVSFLLSRLSFEQSQALERLAPAFVTLNKNRRARIHYEQGKPPWVESRLQDFFGMTTGPALLGGKVPLTLHLLAPNMRAVQVTSDLAGFWSRAYPEVRRELCRRYPKHAWPENPLAK